MNTFIAKRVKNRIPKNWSVEFLDNVAHRGTGHTPNKQFPEYWNGGIKWVSLADSNKLDNRFIYSTDKEISDVGIKKSSAVLHPKGTVILSRDAGVGMSAVLGEDMAVSQHFIAWQCSNKLNNFYLYYWLQFMKTEFERMAVGSTIKTIGMGYFKKLQVLLPTIEEQEQIAQILSSWDVAIAELSKLVELHELKKDALVQRLFRIQNDWHQIHIGSFLSESRIPGTNGETAKKITIKLYGNGVFEKRNNARGSQQTKYFIRKKGQFIYSKLDFLNGAFGIVPPSLDRYESTLDMPAFDIDESIVSSVFFLQFVSRPSFYKNFIGYGNGGRKAKRINPNDLLNSKISIPPKKVQNKIAETISAQSEIIEAYKYKIALQKKQKQGFLQELLTGRLRVK